MARLAAFIVLLIPGVIAAGGIKIMRDSLFGLPMFSSDEVNSTAPILPIWLQFLIGLIMCIAGLAFFAGFLLNRDRKNGRVQQRFRSKKKP
ncbi:DUF2627 domain-containing protein [Sporosarcina sp. CAU 1771]